jgi:hypothetical protein
MRFIKNTLAAVLFTSLMSALLVACGGGSSTPTFLEAYQRIEGGMTIVQVKAIVNSEPNAVAGPYFDGTSSMQWLGPGPSILDVTYSPTGTVIQKIYEGIEAPARLTQKY